MIKTSFHINSGDTAQKNGKDTCDVSPIEIIMQKQFLVSIIYTFKMQMGLIR